MAQSIASTENSASASVTRLTPSKNWSPNLVAAYLCAGLEITNTPRPDHAQYIANWLEVLKGDTKAIFTAASLATRAVDYLYGLQPQQNRHRKSNRLLARKRQCAPTARRPCRHDGVAARGPRS